MRDNVQNVSLSMPTAIYDIIDTHAAAQNSTRTQYAEELIRNGIAAHIRAEQAKDPAEVRIYRHIVFGAFGSMHLEDGGVSFRLEDVRQHSSKDEVVRNITKIQRSMAKTKTTLALPDDLMEYLVNASAYYHDVSISVIIFTYIQAALLAWHWSVNIDDTRLPPQDRERTMQVLEEHRNLAAKFGYDEFNKLTVTVEKNEGTNDARWDDT